MSVRLYEGAKHAALYARYRPTTPSELIAYLLDYVKEQQVAGGLRRAVDVGCGSGQATRLLSPHFQQVLGTDVSAAQVRQATAATAHANVSFQVSPAERLPVPDDSAQLLMTVQAAHWLHLPTFFQEARRVLCRGGALALIGYRLPFAVYQGQEKHGVRQLLAERYVSGLSSWIQRGSVEVYIEAYSDPRFQSPLSDHRRHTCIRDVSGTVRELVGYCSTWSGFQSMVEKQGDDCAERFLQELQHRILLQLGGGATEDSEIIMRFEYFALLSRKLV